MMYRIAIYEQKDSELKFSRYATEKEYYMLRVDRSGRIEELSEHVHDTGKRTIMWFDVSKTHRAEMGMITRDRHNNDLPIYDGDIYINHQTGHKGRFMYPESYINLSPIQPFEPIKIEIVGNIHDAATKDDDMDGV